MRTEIAPELPVMTPDDVKKIEKWFDEAVDGSQKLLAKIHKQDLVAMPEKKEKLKQNTIILGSYKKA